MGTQYSNLYTAVDTPAEAAWLCVCVCVEVCARTFSGHSASEPLVMRCTARVIDQVANPLISTWAESAAQGL
jgi:hypothetical protein